MLIDAMKTSESDFALRFTLYDYVYEEQGIPIQKSHFILIQQVLMDNMPIFRVMIDAKEVHSIQVTTPPQLFRARIFGSQPSTPSFDGSGILYGLSIDNIKGFELWHLLKKFH